MAKHPIFSMRLDPKIKGPWDVAAKRAGLSLAAWITVSCNAALPKTTVSYVDPDSTEGHAVIFTETVEATPEETAALPVETKKKLLTAVGKLKRAPSEKKLKRAAAAESARASVVVPQRSGGMADVHIDPGIVNKKCKHGQGYGQACWKCDHKYGVPEVAE